VSVHCQICGRAIKAKSGLIAHHGYRRPGHGWQTSSCFGARWRPYEVASDALPRAIERATAYRDNTQTQLAKLRANPPAEFDVSRRDAWGHVRQECKAPRPDGFDGYAKRPGSYKPQSYEGAFWKAVSAMEQNIRNAEADIDFMQKRLAAWVPPIAAVPG
jgi:hypothetical protein